ncbi:ComEC/Rec2 family competence protein [Streptomyces sp. NPDC048436]|uniref:ComEC/Rec2 family competence protein n=1 Tax=Streptomyces sp. NPDC048436 TaxID=3365550 RepID=UPI00371F3E43
MTAPLLPSQSGSPKGELAVTILDVGHGNSAIVRDGSRCAVIDAADDTTHAELERIGCATLEEVIVSHVDNDHIAGMNQLLLDPKWPLGRIRINTDASKDTKAWRHLQQTLQLLADDKRTTGILPVRTDTGIPIRVGRAELEVCHPRTVMALAGPRAHDPRFGKVTSNTMAAVVRVLLDGAEAVLLASDIDGVGLRDLLEHGRELSAEVLVFPHHGGLPGSAKPVAFARSLTAAVDPRLVVFSMGTSGRTANPRRDIIKGVREAAPDAHIACTQLSVHCHGAGSLPLSEGHLSDAMARGRAENRCCAGSIIVTHTESGFRYTPPLPQHGRFILDSVTDALCRASSSTFPSQCSSSAAGASVPRAANPPISGGAD